jgi:hypothetical protein
LTRHATHIVNLTPHTGPGSFYAGRFSPDGQTIYLESNQNRELVAIARIQLDSDAQLRPIEVLAGRDNAERWRCYRVLFRLPPYVPGNRFPHHPPTPHHRDGVGIEHFRQARSSWQRQHPHDTTVIN